MEDLFGAVAAMLDEGPTCDRCLGRRFAALSHGLTNAARGEALRTALALREDVPIDARAGVPSVDCWVCDGAFARLDDWADAVVATVEPWEFGTFQVGTRVPPLIAANEELLDDVVGDADAGRFKSEFNRAVGKRVEPRVDAEAAFEAPDVTAILDLRAVADGRAVDGSDRGSTATVSGSAEGPSELRGAVELQVTPLYVYGRYRKLERGIPQTTWHCRDCRGSGCERCDGTGKTYATSVEEELAPAYLDATDGEAFVFHGAGREDVDARMLGDGRPFVGEVKRPRRRDVDLDGIRERVAVEADGAVEVRDLRSVDGGMVEHVKAVDARKRYRARLDGAADDCDQDELAAAAEALEGTTIEQRTPFRVEHRRADRVRERRVHDAAVMRDEDGVALEVETDGGLYVKELVSGDRGRTEPSLSGVVGEDLRVEALDVVDVEGDFLGDA